MTMNLPTRAAAALLLGLLATGAAHASSQEFEEALRQYRAGRLSDAFGRFSALANKGDADAAHIALFMNKYGPQLYGSYWDAYPPDVAQWNLLIRDREGRPQPVFQPQLYQTVKTAAAKPVKRPPAADKARQAPARGQKVGS
jgi:hypothetical protein